MLTHRLGQLVEFFTAKLIVAIGIEAFEQFLRVGRAFATAATMAALSSSFPTSTTHFLACGSTLVVTQLAITVRIEFFKHLLSELSSVGSTAFNLSWFLLSHHWTNEKSHQDYHKRGF